LGVDLHSQIFGVRAFEVNSAIINTNISMVELHLDTPPWGKPGKDVTRRRNNFDQRMLQSESTRARVWINIDRQSKRHTECPPFLLMYITFPTHSRVLIGQLPFLKADPVSSRLKLAHLFSSAVVVTSDASPSESDSVRSWPVSLGVVD
jgi:hypothetical protein